MIRATIEVPRVLTLHASAASIKPNEFIAVVYRGKTTFPRVWPPKSSDLRLFVGGRDVGYVMWPPRVDKESVFPHGSPNPDDMIVTSTTLDCVLEDTRPADTSQPPTARYEKVLRALEVAVDDRHSVGIRSGLWTVSYTIAQWDRLLDARQATHELLTRQADELHRDNPPATIPQQRKEEGR